MWVCGQRHAKAALPPGNHPVPIVQEPGWALGQIWTGAENLAPTGISFILCLYFSRISLFWVSWLLPFLPLLYNTNIHARTRNSSKRSASLESADSVPFQTVASRCTTYAMSTYELKFVEKCLTLLRIVKPQHSVYMEMKNTFMNDAKTLSAVWRICKVAWRSQSSNARGTVR